MGGTMLIVVPDERTLEFFREIKNIVSKGGYTQDDLKNLNRKFTDAEFEKALQCYEKAKKPFTSSTNHSTRK